MENKTKITAFKVKKIPLSKVVDNKDYEVGVSVSNWDKNRYFVILKVANKVHDDLDKDGLVKVNLYYDESFANDNNYHTLVTFTMVAQIYDAEQDKIIDTKKQDYFLDERTKEFISYSPVPVNTVEGSIQGYWHKNKLVEKVEGPFSDADCKTIVSEVKIGTRYYFRATPKQKLHKSELLAMKWSYRYDDDEITSFNYALESVKGNTNIMSCIFHKQPKEIQVYAFYKSPSDTVSVKFNIFGAENEADLSNNDNSTNVDEKNIYQKITIDQIEALFEKYKKYRSFRQEIVDEFNKYNELAIINKKPLHLDTPLRKAHFFAQVGAETLGINPDWMVETDVYSYNKQNCLDTFGERAIKLNNQKKLETYCSERPQKKLLNFLYAHENGKGNGNGNEASGDGYKYRGRGLKQLTGKSNYKNASDFLKEIFPEEYVNLVENPEKVKEAKYAVLTAIAYWEKGEIWRTADKITDASDDDEIKEIRRLVNGTTKAWKDCKKYLEKGLIVFKSNSSNDKTNVGSWHEPVDNPRCTIYMQSGGGGKDTIGEHWGLFGTTRYGRTHQGLDLFVKPGFNVYSCVKSEVYEIKWHKGYGNTLTLKVLDKEAFYNHRREYKIKYSNDGEIIQGDLFDKSQDIFLFYAHLQEVNVKKIDANGNPTQIEAGKVVAKSGVSGVKSGTCAPHLHFEIFTTIYAVGEGLKYRCNPGYYVHFKTINEQSEDEIKEQKQIASKGKINNFYGSQ